MSPNPYPPFGPSELPTAVALIFLALAVFPGLATAEEPDAAPALEVELRTEPAPADGVAPLAPPPAPGPTVEIEIGAASSPPSAAQDDERPPTEGAADAEDADERLLHGFRLGYLFLFNHDVPVDPENPDSSLAREHDLRSPHQFLIGYEVANRITGSGWLNILLLGNAMISGLEQSKFFPSANLLLGFEFDRSFQTGVGINLVPVHDKPAHMILAAGWTPRMGEMYLPVHFFFIPDVDDNHRIGVTVGVNWAS